MSRGDFQVTDADYAYLRNAERTTKVFGDLLEEASLAAASSRAVKNLESLKKRAEDLGRDESARCFDLAIDAVRDGRDAL